MTMSANLHNPTEVTAERSGHISWLRIGSADGCHMSIFMPYAVAQAMAAAFNDAQAMAAAFNDAQTIARVTAQIGKTEGEAA